jgi:hypothetical protein
MRMAVILMKITTHDMQQPVFFIPGFTEGCSKKSTEKISAKLFYFYQLPAWLNIHRKFLLLYCYACLLQMLYS